LGNIKEEGGNVILCIALQADFAIKILQQFLGQSNIAGTQSLNQVHDLYWGAIKKMQINLRPLSLQPIYACN